jgi:hypothetical protein
MRAHHQLPRHTSGTALDSFPLNPAPLGIQLIHSPFGHLPSLDAAFTRHRPFSSHAPYCSIARDTIYLETDPTRRGQTRLSHSLLTKQVRSHATAHREAHTFRRPAYELSTLSMRSRVGGHGRARYYRGSSYYGYYQTRT